MQLPNASVAYVPLRKLTAYLLSDTHPVGKEKALFFQRIGFQKDQPEKLQEALLEVARMGKVSNVVHTPYGTKYVVDGELRTPMSRSVRIRTVWIIESNKKNPRFVTAYPQTV